MKVRDSFGSISSGRGVDDVFAGSDDSLDKLEDEAMGSFLEVEVGLDEGEDDAFSLVLDVENEREVVPLCNERLE